MQLARQYGIEISRRSTSMHARGREGACTPAGRQLALGTPRAAPRPLAWPLLGRAGRAPLAPHPPPAGAWQPLQAGQARQASRQRQLEWPPNCLTSAPGSPAGRHMLAHSSCRASCQAGRQAATQPHTHLPAGGRTLLAAGSGCQRGPGGLTPPRCPQWRHTCSPPASQPASQASVRGRRCSGK